MSPPPAPSNEARLLRLRLNGTSIQRHVEPRTTLLDLVRDHIGDTSAKEVCGAGNCGACTLLLDGRPVYACLVLALECDGCEVTSAAGLGRPEALHPVQEAFLEEDAYQCGFCTPGQVVTAAALLKRHPSPDRGRIVREMSGNLCRCGAYRNILRAVERAAGKDPQE